MEKIILASKSPRRHQLLEWAEIPFEIIVKHTNEDYPSSLPISEVPGYIASQKALAVQQDLSNSNINTTILAADTIVVLNNHILGKPDNEAQAINYLTQLSGNTHQVITGVCILKGAQQIVFNQTTEVSFNTLTATEIENYVTKYKPMDKAGGYAIQEWIGVVGIKSIVGDFYNVMGLPVNKVYSMLQTLT